MDSFYDKKSFRAKKHTKKVKKIKFSDKVPIDRTESRLMPLEFIPNHKMQYRRRYSTANGISSNLSITDLLGSFIIAVTTILGYCPLAAIRLKRVQIWAPVTTQGTGVFVTLSPVATDTGINSFNDMPVVITDASQALDRVAYVDYATKKNTPSGQYHFSTATNINLITYTVPAGSIMDLDFEGILNVNTFPKGFTATLVGATVGTVYSRAIGTNFIPVGVLSI